MAWIEGLTNSQRILFTIANIFTSANKVLETKYRKTVNGTAEDFILTYNSGTEVWTDAEGTVVDIADYTEVLVPTTTPSKDKNWELVYATGGNINDLTEIELNLTSNEIWEIVNGFEAKKVILKTKTTPVSVDASYDEYSTDPDSRVDSIEMFLEIIKYKNAINPEENLETTVHPVTKEALRLKNNHYIEVRYGDKAVIEDTYVIDIATEAVQADKEYIDGKICLVSTDAETGLPVYTPLSNEDAALYKVITVYGNKLLEKSEGGHPSEYAKYSWYVDYKEELIDELDGGPSSDNISKGIKLMPQIIEGMSETIPVQFWINCNNDRVSMVLMGDPTMDYDKYLTSFGYIGKIDSFTGEGVINDTAGNFAMTVGSSSIPAKKPKPVGEPITGKVEVTQVTSSKNNIIDNNGVNITPPAGSTLSGYYVSSPLAINATTIRPIEYVSKYRRGYKFIAFTSDDQTEISEDYDIVYVRDFVNSGSIGAAGSWDASNGRFNITPVAATKVSVSDSTFSIKIRIPIEAKVVKVYKTRDTKSVTNSLLPPPDFVYGTTDPLYLVSETELATTAGVTVSADGRFYEYTWVDEAVDSTVDTTQRPMSLSKANSAEKSVLRDMVLGFVQSVVFPQTWGDTTTATAVNDVSMFKTRSGVYNQRHYASFITPEEYMRKDAFNPSRWTGKFHLSPTYIVHGYDGYRGWLKDTVIVDNTSIVHLDELIVNKDSKDKSKPQEIYKYFKLNAPFSFLNNSPNFNYGVGILKSKSYIDGNGNKIELH